MTIARTLATWAAAMTFDDLPLETVHALERHIADGIGTALAARRLHAADYAMARAERYAPTPPATLFGGGTAGIEGAAFANGVLIHALDFDDTHTGALVHVTAAVLPTALAHTEAEDGSVGDLITTAAIGFEAACRIGMAVNHGFHARGFHATSVVGAIAAALSSSHARGLDEDTTVAALGIAGSFSSGSLEFLSTGSSTKQIHPGWSNAAGVAAAGLAMSGATGPESIIEGPHGLFALFTTDNPDLGSITLDLGSRWESTQISIKPYPVCQLSHASLDAASTIQVEPAEVETITIALPPGSIPIVAEPAATKVSPRSDYEAKFSVQWDVAALLIDGAIGVDSFAADQLGRPDIADLASRVEVVETDHEGVPASAPGSVQIATTDGRTLEGHVARSHGTPDLPLSDDALFAKLAGNVGDQDQAASIMRILSDPDRPVTDLTNTAGRAA